MPRHHVRQHAPLARVAQIVRHRHHERQPVVSLGQPRQIGCVVVVLGTARAEEQPDPAVGVPARHVLQDRLDRREPRAAGYAQHVPRRHRIAEHRPDRRPEAHDVADAGVVDESGADPARRDRPDVQSDRVVQPGRASHREVPPDARPALRLQRQVLAGPEGVALVRKQGDDRDVTSAQLVPDDPRGPPRRGQARVLLGGLDHGPGHELVGGEPGRVHLGGPRGPGEAFDGGPPHHVVVLRPGAELAVVAAELPQVVGQRVRVVGLRDDPDQGLDQPVPLQVHHRREHVPDLGVLQEDQCVEVRGDLFGDPRDQREALPDQYGDPCRVDGVPRLSTHSPQPPRSSIELHDPNVTECIPSASDYLRRGSRRATWRSARSPVPTRRARCGRSGTVEAASGARRCSTAAASPWLGARRGGAPGA